ncbi:signal transduction histidine kinase [Catenulispora sp. GP43]|uniref:sensor histidine kinase n=1 Tax=Catenulispora sp. GP43 TaxID=3156263 RepID=UPI0035135B53
MSQQDQAVRPDQSHSGAQVPGHRRTAASAATAATAAGPDLRRGRAPRDGGWTTRRYLAFGTGAALILLAALSALIAVDFQHTSATSDRLVNRTAPALTASVRLEAAMINQETGVRGYGLTGQTPFLQPYINGLAEQRDAIAALTTLTAGDRQQAADLATVQSRAAAWQERIATPIAASPAGAPPAVAAQRASEGLTLFNALRTAMSAEQSQLQNTTTVETAAIKHAYAQRDALFTAIGLTVLVLVLLVFEGLRRGVTKPLTMISTDTREVTAGDFGHPVAATGPADLRELALDIDAMRERLAEELIATNRDRQALDAQARELRRSNQELEQFAYVASHDLQEPLRKVASFCQLLQRRYAGQLDDRADQYIGYAVDGAERMQKLITDLLAFSRVGRVHHDHALVNLDDCFAAAVDDLEIAAAESGAEFESDPLPTVNGDTTQLTLLFQNLLANAIKFRAPDRPPRIRVSAERVGPMWHLAVTDNGIGIAPEYAERVFLIFQRLHGKDAYPGSGIGLAMCRKIVDFHGGTIGVDTGHQDGTRITFTLPVVEESTEDVVEEPEGS